MIYASEKARYRGGVKGFVWGSWGRWKKLKLRAQCANEEGRIANVPNSKQSPSGSTTEVRRAHGVRWFSQSLLDLPLPYALRLAARRIWRGRWSLESMELKAP